MKPLDDEQQRYLAALRQGATIKSRRGAFLYGFCIGGATLGGLAVGAAVAGDVPWPLLGVGVLFVAAICGAAAARIGPEGILQYLVRSQMPSRASLDKGVSSYQIDGGRAWKIGEKPPKKYWDIGDSDRTDTPNNRQ